MLVVKVELHSSITGQTTELARMTVCNTAGGTRTRGDYAVATMRGRDVEALATNMIAWHCLEKESAITRKGAVLNHARLQEHVWNLVAKALKAMNYGD
jgi:hypothetical protein